MAVKRYEGRKIVVSYDTTRCLHAAECVRGMPAVFDTSRRPWIEPDGGDPDALAAVIARCPTGALHYSLRDGEPEPARIPTRVRFPSGGRLLIEGDIEIDGMRETRAALCRCGASANQPYCDGSGTCSGWSYEPGS